MKQLLIFPYNGNGTEALDCLGDNYDLIGFVDDDKKKQGKGIDNLPVFSRDVFSKYKKSFVLAIPGSPTSYLKRKEIIDGLNIPLKRFVTIIHPKAIIGRNVIVGINTLIMGGSVLTSNAEVGDHVIILPNTVIHHDSIVSNYALIGSNVTVAGHSVIDENCYIGSGSIIFDHIEIGKNTLVGIGSNVIKSFGKGLKLAGNPAKII